jgi:hypothetical protein
VSPLIVRRVIPPVHDELEFEIEFARNDDGPDVDTYHVPIGCFAGMGGRTRQPELAGEAMSSGGRASSPSPAFFTGAGPSRADPC